MNQFLFMFYAGIKKPQKFLGINLLGKFPSRTNIQVQKKKKEKKKAKIILSVIINSLRKYPS